MHTLHLGGQSKLWKHQKQSWNQTVKEICKWLIDHLDSALCCKWFYMETVMGWNICKTSIEIFVNYCSSFKDCSLFNGQPMEFYSKQECKLGGFWHNSGCTILDTLQFAQVEPWQASEERITIVKRLLTSALATNMEASVVIYCLTHLHSLSCTKQLLQTLSPFKFNKIQLLTNFEQF